MMNRRLNSTIMSRLMGSTCFIEVRPGGEVVGDQAPLTVTADGTVTAQGGVKEASSADAPADDQAPPETEDAKAARIAKERENESPEAKTAREAEEAEVARRAALTDEERTAEDATKATEENAAKDKAWAERDKTKDVAVSPEQEAHIAKLAKTPEQIEAMKEFTLETNTTNDLSPASRAKAAALWNVPPEMVDQYVASVISANKGTAENTLQYDDAGQDPAKWSPAMQSALKDRTDALEGVAGGKENLAAFSKWADENLSTREMATLEAAVTASPIVGATVAQTFMARWKAEGNGGGPVDLSRGAGIGGRPVTGGAKPFESKSAQNDAINDPRYSRDASYRESVDARMVATTFRPGAMM